MSNLLQFVLDAALCLSLVLLAWRALSHANLYRATVHFMVFGLLMAIAWARLNAPDIALAEAAIGAGITGALILSTLEVIAKQDTPGASESGEGGS